MTAARAAARVFGCLAALAATAAPGAYAASAAPQRVTISYDVSRNGFPVAEMTEVFESSSGRYQIVSESRAIGLLALFERHPLRFVSAGRLSADGLQPLEFEGKRYENDRKGVRGAFDWKTGRLTIRYGERTQTLPLPAGAQDRLSFLYQFMFMAPFKEVQLALDMTNGRNLSHYLYTLQSGVEIDTPLGRLSTLHIVRLHSPNENGVEIWLSPQHRYLPVRMTIIEEDGTRYEQIATRLDVKETAP
jgi:Protein of unknown function (DUF3108)